MKLRTVLSFLLLVALTASLFVGCGQKEETDAKVEKKQTEAKKEESKKETAKEEKKDDRTLKILTNVTGGKTPDEHELFVKELEKNLGVKVEMIKPSSDYDNVLLTSLSSGEKFDLVYATTPKMNLFVEQEALVDLTPYIEESSILSDRDVVPQREWDLIKTEGGKIYGVPNKFEGGTMPTLRRDWLDEFGMEIPMTLDAWYDYFKKANEVKGAYGLSTVGLYDIQGFMSAKGVKAGYVMVDGKRTIPYATEDAASIYEWFAKLYKEGLLDPNFVANGSGDMRKLFLSDNAAACTYWDMWVGLYNNIRLLDDPNTTFMAEGVPGVPGEDGKIILRRGDSSLWLVPANAENVDLAVKFLEFWHSEPGYLLGTLGIEGHDYTVNGSEYVLTEIGKEHSMDHGAPRVCSPKFEYPIPFPVGVKEAQAIITEYATPEFLPAEWGEAKPIIERYAFEAMKGEISGSEAVAKMQKDLQAKGLID